MIKYGEYGESTFDIIYLLFAITSGIVILAKRLDIIGKLCAICFNYIFQIFLSTVIAA